MQAMSVPSVASSRRSRIPRLDSSPWQRNAQTTFARNETTESERASRLRDRPPLASPRESFLSIEPLLQESGSSRFSPLGNKSIIVCQETPSSPDSGIWTITMAGSSSDSSFPLLSDPYPKLTTAAVPKPPTSVLSISAARNQSRMAQRINDAMIYLDGPGVYCCGECGTHLTTYDDIVSKSFHGRHGRAYLLHSCVNVNIGPAEDRRLMTGLHSVCDLFCKRCSTLIGWTYKRAYEPSQKYKEGKFIVEKIFLHVEDDLHTAYSPVLGQHVRRTWNTNSSSWNRGTSFRPGCSSAFYEDSNHTASHCDSVSSVEPHRMVYEYVE